MWQPFAALRVSELADPARHSAGRRLDTRPRSRRNALSHSLHHLPQPWRGIRSGNAACAVKDRRHGPADVPSCVAVELRSVDHLDLRCRATSRRADRKPPASRETDWQFRGTPARAELPNGQYTRIRGLPCARSRLKLPAHLVPAEDRTLCWCKFPVENFGQQDDFFRTDRYIKDHATLHFNLWSALWR